MASFGTNQQFNLDYIYSFNQELRVVKRTNVPKLGERFNIEIRLEAFNAFNHPSFQTPAAGNTSFAEHLVRSVDEHRFTVRGGGVNSRIVQWAIRLNL